MLSGRFWGGSALFITSCWCLKKRRKAWSSSGVVLQCTRGKSSTGLSSGSKDKQKDGRKCLWGGGNWQTWDSGYFGVNRLKWGEVFEGWEEQKERAAEGIPKRRFQKGGWGRPWAPHPAEGVWDMRTPSPHWDLVSEQLGHPSLCCARALWPAVGCCQASWGPSCSCEQPSPEEHWRTSCPGHCYKQPAMRTFRLKTSASASFLFPPHDV